MSPLNGSRPLCPFCGNNYSRQDALRRHAVKCPQRGTRSLPRLSTAKGRARHACHRCVRKKLHCDGLNPCNTCRMKDVDCVRERDVRHHRTQPLESAQPHDRRRGEERYDASLLCDDYREVFDKFDFPRPPQCRDSRHRASDSWESRPDLAIDETVPSSSMVGLDFDFCFSLFEDELFSLDEAGLKAMEREMYEPLDEAESFGIQNDSPLQSLLAESIMGSTDSSQLLDPTEVLSKLKYLFFPGRMTRLIKQYFDFWHRNCRVVHRPSFTAQRCHPTLLIAVVFLGGMYHPNDDERAMVGTVIEYAETFVFSVLDSIREEILNDSVALDDETSFQVVQAAFLLVVAQFWTGTERARHRAATLRFDRVAEVARHLKLPQSQQTLEDRKCEDLWLRRECRIRTITYLTLLDCAFLFFNGTPVRFASSEIDCDLPSDEDIFDAASPFTHPDFSFRRPCTARSAFAALFDRSVSACRAEMTLLDTFVLIHMLYRFANDMLGLQLLAQHASYANVTADAISALDKWHTQWIAARQKAMDAQQWDRSGFYKHGDQYEAAIRLLLSERARPLLQNLLTACRPRLELLRAINV